MSLTEQQRKYAEARFDGCNKREAAILAGCPEKTAAQAGSRLEKHPNVIAHLARLKAGESAKNPSAGSDAPPPDGLQPFYDDPMEMLRESMNNRLLDPKIRIQAAVALLPYSHQKLGESGKKDNLNDAAKSAAGGRFQPAKPPAQLKLVN